MKKLINLGLLLIIVTASSTAQAQIQSLDEMSISPPTFQNAAYDNLTDLLQESLIYPSTSINKWQEGTEIVRFSISTKGTIYDINVINSVSPEIDLDVIAVLHGTNGQWKPGAVDGQSRIMTREIAISYIVVSYEDMLKTAKNYMQKGNKLMYAKNRPDKALQYYTRAYTLLPNEQSVVSVTGNCLEKLGQTADAQKVWDRLEYLKKQSNSYSTPTDEEFISYLDPITLMFTSE